MGLFALEDLKGLDESLSIYGNRNVAIFMHHHPVSINSAYMDNLMLVNGDAFLGVIRGYANVRAVFFAHIHQEYHCKLGGIDFYGCPSTLYQIKPGVRSFEQDHQAAGFRLIQLRPNGDHKTQVQRL